LNRLLQGYRLSQARLAAVIGLSAPMLSQLISGQRLQTSNPAVDGRVVRLEELLDDPNIAGGDPAELTRVLAEVAASHPVLTTRTAGTAPQPVDAVDPRTLVVGYLAGVAEPAQLRTVAAAAEQNGAERLAALLREASLPR
jgi:transcriptional regulator with XRE-family HTH domain